MCVTIRQQGVVFLINIFFGVLFNAASSIANSLQGMIKGFTFNSTLAFRPQIVKSYAIGDINGMLRLMRISFALAVFLTLLISLPLYLEVDYLIEM